MNPKSAPATQSASVKSKDSRKMNKNETPVKGNLVPPVVAAEASTREKWLIAAAAGLGDLLVAVGATVPAKLLVSVGWPYGSRRAIGQCWSAPASADGETIQIFVSPVLGKDVVQLLQVLLHELVHASVGTACKHAGEFKRVARAVGLEGKLTATHVSEGTELHAKLAALGETLGEYPHIELSGKPLGKAPKGGGDGDGEEGEGGEEKKAVGWIRYQSVREPKYTAVVSGLKVEEHGAPRDPWGEEMVPQKTK